jgi:hypothetical protein
MPCYHPLQGYRARGGKHIVFNPKDGWIDQKVQVPCGQCIGCRLERSRQWAMRCMHEASLYEDNCFITLTYNNDHLPKDGSLHKEHFQKFMKRLRKKHQNKTIRFYHCGEYGEKFRRPHYHAILFNHDFGDKKLFKTEKEIRLYTSKELEELWPYGFNTIGDVTFESAAYTARYIMKKQTGKSAEKHYENVDIETGEIHKILPEYNTMSRRPGIGTEWFKKYNKDVYPKDFVTIRGKKLKPPKFYDRMYEHQYPEDFEKIKDKRLELMNKNWKDNTPDRLRQKEIVKKAQLDKLKRNLEEV